MSFPNKIKAYHTGRKDVIEDVVNRGVDLKWSSSDREWLGSGVYFWAYSVEHAKRWRDLGYQLSWWSSSNDVAILEADIELKNCLNLLEPKGMKVLADAARDLQLLCKRNALRVPQNSRPVNGLPVERRLDCAITNLALLTNELIPGNGFDTVLGAFEDGEVIFPGSTFRRTSHLQISVRNHRCIKPLRML